MFKKLALAVLAAALSLSGHGQTIRPTQIRGISSDTVYGSGGLLANNSPTLTTPTLSGTTTAGAITASGVITSTSSNSSLQAYQVKSSNDGGTNVGIGVFGSAAGSFGPITAGAGFLTTDSSLLVIGANNASGVVKIAVGSSLGTTGATINSSGINGVLGATTPASVTGTSGSFSTQLVTKTLTSSANAAYLIPWIGDTTAGGSGAFYTTTGLTFNPSTGAVAIPGTLSTTSTATFTADATATNVALVANGAQPNYTNLGFRLTDGTTIISNLQAEKVGTNGGQLNLMAKADGGSLTTYATLSSTGLAITGTLSATSNVGIGGSAPSSLFANYRQLNVIGPSGATIDLVTGSTTYGRVVSDANRTYIASFGDSIQLNVGGTNTGTNIATVSSTGLAVTGALSASSGASITGTLIQNTASTANIYIRNLGGVNRIDSYNDPVTATYPLQINASNTKFYVADVLTAQLASSSFAVTGTVSATGAGVIGGSTSRTNTQFSVLGANAKATASSQDVASFSSSDGNGSELALIVSLTGSATAGSRLASIQSVEQGTAYRALQINPNGGAVSIGADTSVTGTLTTTGQINAYNGSGNSPGGLLWIEDQNGLTYSPTVENTPSATIKNEAGGANRVVTLRLSARDSGGGLSNWNINSVGVGSNRGVLAIQNGTSERLRLDESGNLGIGLTNPTYKLQVAVSDNASYQSAAAFSNGVNADLAIKIKTSVTQIGPTTSTPLVFATGDTERARIDSSGNLGLGVTPGSGSNKFIQIGGTAQNFTGSNATHGGSVHLGTASSVLEDGVGTLYMQRNSTYNSGWKYLVAGVAATQYLQGAGAHYFKTAGTATNAGDPITWSSALTIGSDTNAQFYGAISGDGIIRSAGSINPAPTSLTANLFGTPAAGGGYRMGVGLNLSWDGSNWRTGTDGGSNGAAAIMTNYGNGNLGFYSIASTGGTSQTIANGSLNPLMTLDNSGVLDATGGYKINGGTTLSNYTEGTWTPAVRGDGTAGTWTYTTQTGKYSRIGNRVWVDYVIILSTKSGSPTGNAIITGLPVTPAAGITSTVCSVSAYNVTNSSTYSQVVTWVDASTTSMRILESGAVSGNQQYSAVPISAISGSTSIYGSCTYTV